MRPPPEPSDGLQRWQQRGPPPGCEGEHTGPPNEVIFDVVDPDVFGWGGYSGDGRFELVDP